MALNLPAQVQSPISLPSELGLFYGCSGPRDARIAIIGESWGQTEKDRGAPFVGASGEELGKMLFEAGLPTRTECFMSNVVPEKPFNNDMRNFFYRSAFAKQSKLAPFRGLYPKDNVRAGVQRLRNQLKSVKPDIIIGCGNYVLWALTDDNYSISSDEGFLVPSGIGNWRGSQLTINIDGWEGRLLPIYHPASVFNTWAWRYLIVHDLKTRARPLLEGQLEWKEPEYDFTLRPSASQVVERLQWILTQADWHAEFFSKFPLVSDLETRGGMIACQGFAWSKREAICIPYMCIERKDGYWTEEEEFHITKLISQIYRHPGIQIIGQNWLYDAQYVTMYNWAKPHPWLDTMLSHHVCWPGGGTPEKPQRASGITRKDLGHLSSLYCQHHIYWKDDGKDWVETMNEDLLWSYNCKDCIRTYEVMDELSTLIPAMGLRRQHEFQHAQAYEVAFSMMLRGIPVNRAERSKVALELAAAVERYTAAIESLIPPDVYPRKKGKNVAPWTKSATQQMEIFYDLLGVKPVLDKKKKTPTVGKNALPIIGKREPILLPIVKRLGDVRRFEAFHRATQMVVDPDGRMRCSFNPAGTETFRWSSSRNAFGGGGNLQNVSKGTEDDENSDLQLPNMRKFLVPDPGFELVEFDLSGAEAQVTAWEADDADLKAAFRAGLKVHIKNARAVFPELTRGLSDDELKATDHQGGVYYKCKRFVHGTENGGSPKGIAQMVGCPVSEVAAFQERWFSLHPGILRWHERVGQEIAETRSVSNRFGFRIKYFDHAENLRNQALAWIKQSTVAVVACEGGIRLARQLKEWQGLLQVHDSLVGQYRIEYRNQIRLRIKQILSSIIVPYDDPLQIPWGASASTKSWGDVQGIKDWKDL